MPANHRTIITADRIIVTPDVIVTGCRADCPNTRPYNPNEDGETLGCSYKYGTLPQEGFPEWCPLPKSEVSHDAR